MAEEGLERALVTAVEAELSEYCCESLERASTMSSGVAPVSFVCCRSASLL
jgi:hypothetical protein